MKWSFSYYSFVKLSIYCKFEIFVRILFSPIALKDIFVTLEIRDLGMIYLYHEMTE